MIPTMYLAGAITAHPDGQHGNGWRSFIQETYDGIEWINPLDYEHPDMEYGSFYDDLIVERDLMLIDRSDAIIMEVRTDIYQWGTPQEQFYAHGTGTPVIVWYEGDPADLSPWCRFHHDYIATSIEEAVEVAYEITMGEKYGVAGVKP